MVKVWLFKHQRPFNCVLEESCSWSFRPFVIESQDNIVNLYIYIYCTTSWLQLDTESWVSLNIRNLNRCHLVTTNRSRDRPDVDAGDAIESNTLDANGTTSFKPGTAWYSLVPSLTVWVAPLLFLKTKTRSLNSCVHTWQKSKPASNKSKNGNQDSDRREFLKSATFVSLKISQYHHASTQQSLKLVTMRIPLSPLLPLVSWRNRFNLSLAELRILVHI